MRNAGRAIIVLLGGPGAGKGTQAQAMTDRFGLPQISTGELLRDEGFQKSPIGLKAREIMDSGGLVPDELVHEQIAGRILRDDCRSGFILDGYPRNLNQVFMLRQTLLASDRLIAIDIDSDLEQLIPRLTGRRTCPACSAIYHIHALPPRCEGICNRCGGVLMQRSDDREEVIRERFATYRRLTQPLTDLFREWGIYNRVDGMQSPDHVAADLFAIVQCRLHRKSPQHRAA